MDCLESQQKNNINNRAQKVIPNDKLASWWEIHDYYADSKTLEKPSLTPK